MRPKAAPGQLAPNDDGTEGFTTGNDLRHDPWLACAGQRLEALAKEMFRQLETLVPDTGRKPRADALERRFQVMANLVANLALSALQRAEEGRAIAVSMRNNATTRYDRTDFPRQVVPRIVRALEQSGAIVCHPGARNQGRTAIAPSRAFLSRLQQSGATLADIGRAAGGETIVLRAGAPAGKPKTLIDYADTEETIRLRAEMERINAFLNAANVTIDGRPQVPFLLTRRFQIAAPDAPHTFDQHGRIYDGFWINMHRTERHRLRIGGEELADLDFTGMFTQLAYLHAGLPLPEGDPYGGIEGLEPDPIADLEENARKRDAIKRGLNAFYFRTGRMQRLPHEVKELLGPDWTATRFAIALRKRHLPIKHLFGTGVGLRLMFTESRILVQTLLDLIGQGIPALPIHDGIMVPVSKQHLAEETMRRVSRSVLGVELPVKIKQMPKPGCPAK